MPISSNHIDAYPPCRRAFSQCPTYANAFPVLHDNMRNKEGNEALRLEYIRDEINQQIMHLHKVRPAHHEIWPSRYHVLQFHRKFRAGSEYILLRLRYYQRCMFENIHSSGPGLEPPSELLVRQALTFCRRQYDALVRLESCYTHFSHIIFI